MVDNDRFADTKLIRLQLCLYLLPVVGILPSLWQLRQPPEDNLSRQHRRLSKKSLQLTLGWLGIYVLLWGGAGLTSEIDSLRMMYLNGLITSGYFLTCLVWMGWIFFQPSPSQKK
jgi:hypothetical protein